MVQQGANRSLRNFAGCAWVERYAYVRIVLHVSNIPVVVV